MTSTAHTAATDHSGHSAPGTAMGPRAAAAPAAGSTTDRKAEYRTLMRKWWFAAAVGAA